MQESFSDECQAEKTNEEIRLLAQTKLESIQNIISKALTDGRVSDLKFERILSELERYRTLKQELCHKAKKKTEAITDDQMRSNLGSRKRREQERFFKANRKYFRYPECKCHIS